MIFYLYHFPQKGGELGALMRTINLLQECKYFMSCDNVRRYLLVFHEYVGEEEEYQAYENSILDMAIALQM